MRGPVQVLVLGFDHPVFSGELAAELTRLREAGVVRLLDVLLVSRVDDDTFETIDTPPGLPPQLGRLTAELLGRPAGAGQDEADPGGSAEGSRPTVWSLAESVPVGSTAAVALIEHVWAVPLRDAVRRAGGVPLDESWLAEADVELLDALSRDADR